MPKIGTICDSYKVKMFKEEFDKAGIKYTVEPMGKDLAVIITRDAEQSIIKPIVDKVTQFYIDKYKKK